MQVYLGWDSREPLAYEVAERSICMRTAQPVAVTPIKLSVMEQGGLMWRRTERQGIKPGSLWDVISSAPMSTEFALTRFLVPLLQQSGWALFADSDIVCLGDIAELFALADERYAVMCVQHGSAQTPGLKMDGQVQQIYPRKNWSSVVLWNCGHLAHRRLDVRMVNTWPGDLLHRFAWLRDSEIGALPPEWNWLVGVEEMPAHPKIAHFTLGGPWLPGWTGAQHDEVWNAELERTRRRAA